MANSPISRSDVLEKEYDAATTTMIRGLVILLASLILFWLLRVFNLIPLSNLFLLTCIAGAVVMIVAGRRMYMARSTTAIPVECPYCGGSTEFVAAPSVDWTCERCNRRVYYENGKIAPVRTITCPSCRAEHQVSVKAPTYTCDRCNRTLRLSDGDQSVKIASEPSDLLRNYDVILTQAGRTPDEVAMALQDILVCNLRDARARMEDVPLTVVRNVPEIKANSIRMKLRELGATAVIRPTADETESPRTI